MPKTRDQIIEEILGYEIDVELEKPTHGYWDGGAKQHFTFSPTRRNYANGIPNIEWGSWGANFWFRVEVGPNAGNHLAMVKRKLMKGEPARKVTIRKIEIDAAAAA